jgi:hypothetical protein
MLSTIEKLFAVLVKLLKHEASKHGKAAAKIRFKAHANRKNEELAVANIRQYGANYRAELDYKSNVQESQARRASALACKIGSIIE